MPTTKKPVSNSFAGQFAELEKIVHTFEHEDIDLDRGLQLFEQGLKLAEKLKQQLASVENTIVTLKKRYRVDDNHTSVE